MTRNLWFWVTVIAIALCPAAQAGRLDKFEKSATSRRPSRSSHNHDNDDDLSCLGDLIALFLEGIFDAACTGPTRVQEWTVTPPGKSTGTGMNTMPPESDPFPIVILPVQTNGPAGMPPPHRPLPTRPDDNPFVTMTDSPGPTLRFDIQYQGVQSNIDAIDYRGEIGYKPFSLEARHSRYWEHNPSDQLDMTQIHGLLRIPLGDKLDIGLGGGLIILAGNDSHAGASLAGNVVYGLTDRIALEYRLTSATINESTTSDHSLATIIGRPEAALRAGYRFTDAEGISLNGWFVGLSVNFDRLLSDR